MRADRRLDCAGGGWISRLGWWGLSYQIGFGGWEGNRSARFELRPLQGASRTRRSRGGVPAGRHMSRRSLSTRAAREAATADLLPGAAAVSKHCGRGRRRDGRWRSNRLWASISEGRNASAVGARARACTLPGPRYETTFLARTSCPGSRIGRQGSIHDVTGVCQEMLPGRWRRAGLATAVDAFMEGIAFSEGQTAMVFPCPQKAYGLPVGERCMADQLFEPGAQPLLRNFSAHTPITMEHTE